ncbi:hypothetical protein M885DRAFT_429169, partial [Pelagophyceae sp. CCMP2097]
GRLAESGNAKAMFEHGSQLLAGAEMEKRPAEGFAWLVKAAALGDDRANNKVGTCYLHGEGVAVDHSAAAECFIAGVARGHYGSQFNLGVMYHNAWAWAGAAEDMKANEKAALDLFRRCSDVGYATATFYLASLLFR